MKKGDTLQRLGVAKRYKRQMEYGQVELRSTTCCEPVNALSGTGLMPQRCGSSTPGGL
jgi:hypothetical protein